MPKVPDKSSQEELESLVPDQDDVASHEKDLQVIQSAFSEADRRLDLVSIKALNLTAPDPPYAGSEALDRARRGLKQVQKDLAEAQTGLQAAEEQWQHQRS